MRPSTPILWFLFSFLLAQVAFGLDLKEAFRDGGLSKSRVALKVAPTQWLSGEVGASLHFLVIRKLSLELSGSRLGPSEHIWHEQTFNFPDPFSDSEVSSPLLDQVKGGRAFGAELRWSQYYGSIIGLHFFGGTTHRHFSFSEAQSVSLLEHSFGASVVYRIARRGVLELKGGYGWRNFNSQLTVQEMCESVPRRTDFAVLDPKRGLLIF